jgi:hypothetical protein
MTSDHIRNVATWVAAFFVSSLYIAATTVTPF